jgi:hypothetical protein
VRNAFGAVMPKKDNKMFVQYLLCLLIRPLASSYHYIKETMTIAGVFDTV